MTHRQAGDRRPAGARHTINTERLGRMGQSAARVTAPGRRGGQDSIRRRVTTTARAVTAAAARKGATYLADAVGSPVAGAVVRTSTKVVEKLGLRRLLLVVAAAIGALCCFPAVMLVAMLGALGGGQPPAAVSCGPVSGADLARFDTLDSEQRANGELIVTVGADLGVPPRGWVVAVATAMQESGLRNLEHQGGANDHDSLGLFQQRPSQGWGSEQQLLDPQFAATAFYRALIDVDGWQRMPLTQAAQAVQRSAYPNAYARHEPLAVAVVGSVTGGVVGAAGFDGDVRCAGPAEVTAAGWTIPAPGPVGSSFRTTPRPDHHGIDIDASRGTVVRAAADGTVTLVRCNATVDGKPYRCDIDGSPAVAGCGWYVNILHAGDVSTRYCHMLSRPDVDVGQQVMAGQPIGRVGSSGSSSGPHLHFEVHLGGDMSSAGAVDPTAFLSLQGVQLSASTSVGSHRSFSNMLTPPWRLRQIDENRSAWRVLYIDVDDSIIAWPSILTAEHAVSGPATGTAGGPVTTLGPAPGRAQRQPDNGERGDGVVEEHRAEPAECEVGALARKAVELRVGALEGDVVKPLRPREFAGTLDGGRGDVHPERASPVLRT